MNNPQTALNESNSKVAARSQGISKLVADLETRLPQAVPPVSAHNEKPTVNEKQRFIDPVTGMWDEADASAAPTQPEQFFTGSLTKE